MIVFIIILLGISLYRSKVLNWNFGFLDLDQVKSIRGIFVLIIFFSHVRGYIDMNSRLDFMFDETLSKIGQLMVAPFFFYSGYGVYSSWIRKPDYARTFLKNRILRIIIPFEVSLLFYAAIAVITHTQYDFHSWLLCWTAWTNIGNSNWFVFDIAFLYMIFLAVMRYAKSENKNHFKYSTLMCVLTGLLILCLVAVKKQSWWYNTLICFPYGMLVARYKGRITDSLRGDNSRWTVLFGLITVTFVMTSFFSKGVYYNIYACLFVSMLVAISMKIQIKNDILMWLGKRSFSIYLLQRIPMIIIREFNFIERTQPGLFIVISLFLSLGLSAVFEKVLNRIYKWVLT